MDRIDLIKKINETVIQGFLPIAFYNSEVRNLKALEADRNTNKTLSRYDVFSEKYGRKQFYSGNSGKIISKIYDIP